MGCMLGAIIVVGLTFLIGWPIGTLIGVALFVAVEWALMKQRQEEQALQNEANHKVVER